MNADFWGIRSCRGAPWGLGGMSHVGSPWVSDSQHLSPSPARSRQAGCQQKSTVMISAWGQAGKLSQWIQARTSPGGITRVRHNPTVTGQVHRQTQAQAGAFIIGDNFKVQINRVHSCDTYETVAQESPTGRPHLQSHSYWKRGQLCLYIPSS